MLKKILKNITFFLIFLTAISVCLLSDFNPIFKKDDFVSLTKTLDTIKAKDLEPIISIYNQIHKTVPKGNLSEAVLYNIYSYRRSNLFTKALYILKLKKDFTNEACLKFELLHYDFTFRNIGVRNASLFYFHKKIEELTEREKIAIVAMLQNPALYNPVRNKDRLDKKVLLYEKIIH